MLYLFKSVQITNNYFGFGVQSEAESWQPVPSVAMVTSPLPAINGGVVSLLCPDSQGVGGVSVHVVVHGQAVGLIYKFTKEKKFERILFEQHFRLQCVYKVLVNCTVLNYLETSWHSPILLSNSVLTWWAWPRCICNITL